jgi:predicted oxidoreductase
MWIQMIKTAIISNIMITQKNISSAERSLKNLQTDYLDVFFCTQTQSLMQSDEIAEI